METLLQDLRYGLRTLLKNKAFTAAAVLTLALAIGANTAIFSIVNQVLLTSLPVPDARSLVIVGDPSDVYHRSNGTPSLTVLSYPLYEELAKDSSDLFSSVYASGDIRRMQLSTSPTDQGTSGRGRFVTSGYFSTLGIHPAAGRFFSDSETDIHHPTSVAVISYRYWQQQFAGAPAAVGQTVRINTMPFTIIGVAPKGFDGEIVNEAQKVWIPLNMQPSLTGGKSWVDDPRISWLQVMGRLKPGVTREQAEARLNVKFQQLLNSNYGATLMKEDREAVAKQHLAVAAGERGFSWARDAFGRPMVLLMIIVGLVLVMACTNISNMLLARSSSRTREIALRVAIGARPGRVLRQLITESVLLAFLGGIAGLAVAQFGTQMLLRWVIQRYSSISLNTSPDARVLGFAALLCLFTGVLFGLVPALRALKVELTSVLGTTRASAAHGMSGFFSVGNLLVAAQFAVSMLVITGAGMLIRSLYNLQDVDLGYAREQLVVMKTDPMALGYDSARVEQLGKLIPPALLTVPGVKAASVSENGIFSGTESGETIKVEGFTTNKEDDMNAAFDQIGPGYFQTIGAQILLGRDFTERDQDVNQKYVIINETMAKFYFNGQNPIGRKITAPDEQQVQHTFEIVGVVRDIRDHSVRKPVDRRYYLPFVNASSKANILNFEIRTSGNAGALNQLIRQKMSELAPGLPVVSLNTIDDLAQGEVFEESMLARLSGMFGMVALVLASIGLYGLMSYMVAVRTKEIGIRLALGAQPKDIVRGIVKQAVILAATGVAVGVPIALLSGHAMKTTLYEVGGGDPLSLVISASVLAAVAMIASLLPALNAIRVDPMVVLRYE